MAVSGSITFPPVLHNITPDRVAFCYRQGDADSLEVAQYYCEKRLVPAQNLIALPCTDDNKITQAEMEATIETPLIEALQDLGNEFTSSGLNEIWVIILGYNIPHIYEVIGPDPYIDDNDQYAIASRLHRLGKTVDFKHENHTYDRRSTFFKYFDAEDSQELYITAVIDGPTVAAAKKLIDRALDVDNQTFVTGAIYLDPYGMKNTQAQLDYEADILDFYNNSSPNLGLDVEITVDNPVPMMSEDPYFPGPVGQPYQDPLIDFLKQDSFYWGWFIPEFSQDLFLNQNERRVFLYNADYNSADDIAAPLDVFSSNPWVNLAINVEPGYACCAGAVASPDENAYLRPRPFFETLHRGATIGEAFLYSSRFVDWRIVLIGDPLTVVNFPNEIPNELDPTFELIDNNEVIRRVKLSLEKALGYGARQERLTNELLITATQSRNFAEALNLFYTLNHWSRQKNFIAHKNLFSNAVSAWLTYILQTEGLTLSQWLDEQNEKISFHLNEVITSIASSSIDSEYIYEQGHWIYDFEYNHEILTLENIHFELEVSLDSTFTDIVASLATLTSIVGWKYESEADVFVQFPTVGFPSNFSGRRIRFDSPSANFLRRTEEYYVRWRALRDTGIPLTDYFVDSNLFLVSH